MIVKNIPFSVNGQTIKFSTMAQLVANSAGIATASFSFSTDWSEYDTIKVIFSNGDTKKSKILTGGITTVTIPSECVIAGRLVVSAVGLTGAEGEETFKRATTERNNGVEIIQSGAYEGDPADLPTPTEAEQMLLIVSNADTTAEQANETANSANNTAQAALERGAIITIGPYDSLQKNNAKVVLNGGFYDAEKINGVINELTNGGKILLLDGTIHLHQPIRLRPNIIMEGSGDSTVFKVMEDIDAIENTELLSNCILRDFLIDGNKADITYTNGGNALHLFMTHSTVERVKTQNIKKSALLLNWDSNVSDDMAYLNKIFHCEFEDSEEEAVKWGWRTTDSWFCYNNVGSTKANLRIEGGSCRFIGNHLDGSPEYNIYMGGGCEVMSFSQNVIENAQKHAILLEKPGYATSYKSVSFNDNLVRGCSRNASGSYDLINISGYDADHKNTLIQIVNNRMINSNEEKPRYCIHADYTDNMIISGNVFSGYNESVPINITENCLNCVAANNVDSQ